MSKIMNYGLVTVWGLKMSMYLQCGQYDKAVKLAKKINERFPISTDSYPGEWFIETLRSMNYGQMNFNKELFINVYEAEEKGR